MAACLQLHKLEHEALRGAIGSAKVAVQRAVAAKLAAQRAELLAGAPPGAANGTAAGAAAKPLRSEGDLLAASNDITQGLRRTRQLMAQQIETTSGNLALLGKRPGMQCAMRRP